MDDLDWQLLNINQNRFYGFIIFSKEMWQKLEIRDLYS